MKVQLLIQGSAYLPFVPVSGKVYTLTFNLDTPTTVDENIYVNIGAVGNGQNGGTDGFFEEIRTGGSQATPNGGSRNPVYTLSYTYNPNAAGTDANISIGFMNPTDAGTTGRAFFFQEVRSPSQMALQVIYGGNTVVNIADPAANSPADYKIAGIGVNPYFSSLLS